MKIRFLPLIAFVAVLAFFVCCLVVVAANHPDEEKQQQNREVKVNVEITEKKMEGNENIEETTIKDRMASIDENTYKFHFVGDVAYECIDVIDITATAYCHCEKCCGKAPDNANYGVTASGLNLLATGADTRIVAADLSLLPFGTKIYIEVPEEERDVLYVNEDYGIATVEDTGGAIKGNRIDVYFPTHQEALEWGVRHVKVHVIVPIS